MRRLDTRERNFSAALKALLAWEVREDPAVAARAKAIIERVRKEGNAALLSLTRELDKVDVVGAEALELDPALLQQALGDLNPALREALELARQRIADFHQHQHDGDFEFEDAQGHRLGQRSTPLDRVGLYVPGGRAAYPSTVLMTAIPARVAGVRELVMTVPTPNGERNPLVLAAAALSGVDRVFTVGGAQAIAALAYGTTVIPQVDKIVGPGNAYVAAAKRMVYGTVGIDAIAGPSEILIVADDSAPVDWAVLDLFSQAEHDPAAQSILISWDAAVLDAIAQRIPSLLAQRTRRAIIEESLNQRGALILARDADDAADVANRIAAEHVQLMVREPRRLLEKVRHGGAMFLGSYSAEVLGDYVAGPSHVLPTYGTARFSSPLSVYDFRKRSSVIELNGADLRDIAEAAHRLADGEGLEAHGQAALARHAADNT